MGSVTAWIMERLGNGDRTSAGMEIPSQASGTTLPIPMEYNDSVVRVYADGLLKNTQHAAPLDTWANFSVRIGAQQ
jgi:hypothetical protein